MKNLPRTIISADDALARGMDFAFVTLGFFGVGFLLDRWLGTTPLFMILLVVVALVGLFARIWYQYEASMRRLESERASTTHRVPAGATSAADRAADRTEDRVADRVDDRVDAAAGEGSGS